MSTIIIDGRVRVTFMTACANILLPTAAELNAGSALESLITPDGLDIEVGTNEVPNSNLGSTNVTSKAGRKVPKISITIHHDSITDLGFTLLTYRAAGFLAVRMGIDKATAWTTGQGAGASTGTLKVFTVEAGEYNDVKAAQDTNWDLMVPIFCSADFTQRAVVA